MVKDEFNKSSIIIFVLTTTASAINYLCQILMGRVMSLEVFGIMNAIFSFIIICGVPGTSFNLLMTKYASENHNNYNKITNYLLHIMKIIFILLLLTIPISLFGKETIGKILGVNSLGIVIITILIIIIGFIPAVFSGILSGVKCFMAVGILSLIIPIFKLLGVVIIKYVNTIDTVVIIILLCFMLIGTFFSIFLGRKFLGDNKIRYSVRDVFLHKEKDQLVIQGIKIFIVNLLLTFFTNADVLLINMLFGGEQVGMYSSTILFGRIVYYFVTSLVTVMLPFVVRANTSNNNPLKILKKTLLYTLVFSIICLLPLNVFSGFFLTMIFGEKFSTASQYMNIASIISVLSSVLTIIMNYLIGVEKTDFFIKSLMIGLIMLLIAVFSIHAQVIQVLVCLAIILLIIVVSNLIYCFFRSDSKSQI